MNITPPSSITNPRLTTKATSRVAASPSLSRATFLATAVFLAACSGENATDEPDETPVEGQETETPETEQAQVEEEAPEFAVHEWGLVDVLEDGSSELAAGAGNQEHFRHDHPGHDHEGQEHDDDRPTPMTTAMTSPMVSPPSIANTPVINTHPPTARKPVLYFHSDESFEVGVQVTMPGEVAEHWPPANVQTPGQVSWNRVTVGAEGPCTDRAYPVRGSSACVDAPDGYCELADLATYETEDATCLGFDGQTWNHLFYRGRALRFNAGVAPHLNTGELAFTNRSVDAEIGAIYVVDRRGDAVFASMTDAPAAGESVALETPSEEGVAAVRAGISEQLRARGLTEDEAAAFEAAWFDEFFGSGETQGAPTVPVSVLYFIPASMHDGISTLTFDPAPSTTTRVFMARMAVEYPQRGTL